MCRTIGMMGNRVTPVPLKPYGCRGCIARKEGGKRVSKSPSLSTTNAFRFHLLVLFQFNLGVLNA